jgi:hypothetical protein
VIACELLGVPYPLGVERVMFVVPFATAWKVDVPDPPVIEIGLVTVPTVVLDDATGTETVTPGLNCCWAKTLSETGTKTTGAIPSEVSLPTEAVKSPLVRMNPEGLTFTVTVAFGYPEA